VGSAWRQCFAGRGEASNHTRGMESKRGGRGRFLWRWGIRRYPFFRHKLKCALLVGRNAVWIPLDESHCCTHKSGFAFRTVPKCPMAVRCVFLALVVKTTLEIAVPTSVNRIGSAVHTSLSRIFAWYRHFFRKTEAHICSINIGKTGPNGPRVCFGNFTDPLPLAGC
jgi:hypothetical protein